MRYPVRIPAPVASLTVSDYGVARALIFDEVTEPSSDPPRDEVGLLVADVLAGRLRFARLFMTGTRAPCWSRNCCLIVIAVISVAGHCAWPARAGDIVVGRVGGYRLAPELWLQEIKRRLWDIGRLDLTAVVGVGDQVDGDADPLPIWIVERCVDRLPALGHEAQQSSLPLPAGEILQGLKHGDVNPQASPR